MFGSGTLAKVGLLVTVASLVFQILGFSCPGWMVVNTDLSVLGITTDMALTGYGEVATESALWFVRVCIYDDASSSCSTSTEHNAWTMGLYLSTALKDLQNISWVQAQILLTVALVLCLVAMAAIIVNLCEIVSVNDRVVFTFIAANTLVSGILIFPPVLDISIATENAKTDVKTVLSSDAGLVSVGTPFALILSAIGLVLAIAASAIFLTAMLKVKTEKFPSTIFPTSYLSPAILKIGNFPANISMSDRIGHIPPTFNNSQDVIPPPIGSKDEEPLTFENMVLRDGSMYEPYVLFPPQSDATDGVLRPLGDTTSENSLPPPYGGLETNTERKRFAGSLSLGKNLSDVEDEDQVTTTSMPPRSPTSKTVKLRKVSGNDVESCSQLSSSERNQSHEMDTLGKDLHTNTGLATNLAQQKSSKAADANRSPTSSKKTITIKSVNEERLSGKAGHTDAQQAKETNIGTRKTGPSHGKTGARVEKRNPYVPPKKQFRKAQNQTPRKTTLASSSNPSITKKTVKIEKVQEDELLM